MPVEVISIRTTGRRDREVALALGRREGNPGKKLRHRPPARVVEPGAHAPHIALAESVVHKARSAAPVLLEKRVEDRKAVTDRAVLGEDRGAFRELGGCLALRAFNSTRATWHEQHECEDA